MAKQVTWAKVSKAIREADVGYIYNDGSLVLHTTTTYRGARVAITTLVEGFTTALSCRRYDKQGEEFHAGDWRVIFHKDALGSLSIARPSMIRPHVGDTSESSKREGIYACGVRLMFRPGEAICLDYLSKGPSTAYCQESWSPYLVSGDVTIQLDPQFADRDMSQIDEHLTLRTSEN